MRLPVFPLPSLRLTLPLMLALGAALAGCDTLPEAPTTLQSVKTALLPYKPEIVQGNVITAEMLAAIKPGMSRGQVRDILGQPLIADAFHAQRWDYVFTLRRQGLDPVQRSLVVLFDKDVVGKVEAPAMPTETDFIASISRSPLPKGEGPKLELSDDERAKLPTPKTPFTSAGAAAAASAAAGPTRSFPPLEPR